MSSHGDSVHLLGKDLVTLIIEDERSYSDDLNWIICNKNYDELTMTVPVPMTMTMPVASDRMPMSI